MEHTSDVVNQWERVGDRNVVGRAVTIAKSIGNTDCNTFAVSLLILHFASIAYC